MFLSDDFYVCHRADNDLSLTPHVYGIVEIHFYANVARPPFDLLNCQT